MQTIGERLEEARKKKGISIREAAEATKIRGDYLQKFESNHFDIGLTEIYTRGFLRTYANYLKLPADRILNDYAALGRGDIRPRQPSREVYGRMDISVATTESGERANPAPEAPPEPSPMNRGPQRPRTGSSLPTGPDPAVVFKYVKIGGIVVVVILVLLLLKALLFNDGRSPTPTNPPATVTPRGPTLSLTALRTVQVRVHRVNPDKSDGELIFSGTLRANETQQVPRTSSVYVEATPADALEIDVNGFRFNLARQLAEMGRPGNKAEIPGPQ